MFNKSLAFALMFITAAVLSVARAGEPVPVPVEEDAASVAPYIEGGPPPQFAQPVAPPPVQAPPAAPAPATMPPPPAAAPSTPAAPKAASGSIARGVFTTRVANKEPVDDLAELPADTQRIYFFTELNNLSGHTVRHRWERNGTFQGESTFEVRGWHWRVWSLKTIGGRTGLWKVTVLDTDGNVIGEKSIQVGAP